jgi:hypothetical protein
MTDEEREALESELCAAYRAGDRAREDEIQKQLDAAFPRPKKAPPPVLDGKTWRDIGDGWQELATKPIEGLRRIRGIASSEAVSTHKQSLEPVGMSAVLPVPLRTDHALDGRGIGVVDLIRRNKSIVYFEAAIHDTAAGRFALNKAITGHFKAVSVGPKKGGAHTIVAKVAGVLFYDKWELGELSMCEAGANPHACFELCSPFDCDWREYVASIERAAGVPSFPETAENGRRALDGSSLVEG